MRTTLTIDDDVAARLEQLRRAGNASFKEIVNETLRLGLKEMNKPRQAKQPFQTKSVSLGRCLVGNVDDISDILALADGDDFKGL